MKNLILFFLTVFISSCGCGDIMGDISTNKNIGTLSILVKQHNNSNYYVTNLSDTPYYFAISVENNSTGAVTINDINLANNQEFEVVADNTYYPSNQNMCIAHMKLNSGDKCEIIIGLIHAQYISSVISQLNIVTDNNTYTKQLIKKPLVYIAGNFSQTYNSNPVINSIKNSNGHCGVNQDSLCTILEYDILNNSVVNIAQTNWNVNSIVADKNGVLYIGGGFDMGFTNTQTIIGPIGSTNSTMLLTLNPSNGQISDFLKNIGQTNYPNDEIYALGYNHNSLYMAGGFNSIANVTSSNTYPIIRYNFNSNLFDNALGNNANNPDSIITAIGFDQDANLYISGLYSGISNFFNLYPFGIFSINKCTLNSNSYECNNNINDVTYIDSTSSYQPATSINFDSNDNLYTAGGFSQINNNVGQAGTQNYLVAQLTNTNMVNIKWNDVNYGQAPNRPIGVVTPTNIDNGYFVGGWFSTIGGLAIDLTENGQCGLFTDQFSNGINSCMLAKYDGLTNKWNKIFTTDGMINVFTVSSKLEVD